MLCVDGMLGTSVTQCHTANEIIIKPQCMRDLTTHSSPTDGLLSTNELLSFPPKCSHLADHHVTLHTINTYIRTRMDGAPLTASGMIACPLVVYR